MLKPKVLKKGDGVAIVSLSSGILGEDICKHQLALGEKRLIEMGLKPIFMKHTLKGLDFIKNHPKARAQDLKDAYRNPSVKAIICAIGGDDTYRLLPYLITDLSFIDFVKANPKIFVGFSDSTNNHFFFYKMGVVSYYGLNFLSDLAELSEHMLPYTEKSYQMLLNQQVPIIIESSPCWYEERTDYSIKSLNTPRVERKEIYGYEVLRGTGVVFGTLLGGCLESMYDMITGDRYADQKDLYEKYHIFPDLSIWKDKILFIETSEEKPSPDLFRSMIRKFSDQGILRVIKAMIVGKPQDELYYNEYRHILLEETQAFDLPIMYNLNYGHGSPRALLPYGVMVSIDFNRKRFSIVESMFLE